MCDKFFKENGATIIGELYKNPNGDLTFYAQDPNGNIFQIVQGRGYFSDTKHPSYCGGVAGSIIGVSDIEKALPLYRDILGYETIEYDVIDHHADFSQIPGGSSKFRRVLLTHKESRKGPFARLLGPTQIELVQALERTDCKKIFENRFWGDWGFIHLCFDIQGMDLLQKECESKGFLLHRQCWSAYR